MGKEKKGLSSEHPPADDNAEVQRGTRRRGTVLEDAILLAAWEELFTVGYGHLTMEGIATRVQTNKAVLYRRWPNKGRLIMAAMKKFLPESHKEVPDSGDLRTDVLILLRSVAEPLQIIGAETIHGLLVDLLDKEKISSIPSMLQTRGNSRINIAMKIILQHAQDRGDIHLEKITPRIISLPMDLMILEVFTRHEPLSEATLNEIVDEIFLPLVTGGRG
ncbi:TetR/AcrR family transcriptional regulator [Methanospirillum lacunae]|uniref:TetR family transcriptional regulator n=2 Tax=Methanospirillum lacunae TaxID=668570 RepID=A0A2V2MWH5_9EURY|nr:TetR/AcrR family transcriptional regulator [Methanospirillum lacunae]PWR71739.1 TetR family transcriptional regulator [Methanospirillum lacunae]